MCAGRNLMGIAHLLRGGLGVKVHVGAGRSWADSVDWSKRRRAVVGGKASSRAKKLCGKWGLKWDERVVMAPQRAEKAVETWRAGSREKAAIERGEVSVPARVKRTLAHTTKQVMPTLLANPDEHPYLPTLGREVTAGEHAKLMGIVGGQGGDETRQELMDMGREEGGEEKSRTWQGEAVHVDAAALVVEAGMRLAGMAKVKRPLKFGDIGSGVGTMALAVGRAAGETVDYRWAVEENQEKQDFLQRVWGDGVKIEGRLQDASRKGAAARKLDVASVTLDCGAWTKNTRTQSVRPGMQLGSIEDSVAAMRLAAASKPTLIVYENSAEIDMKRGGANAETLVRKMQEAAPGREWWGQRVCAQKHAGSGVRRERLFLVAVLRKGGKGRAGPRKSKK